MIIEPKNVTSCTFVKLDGIVQDVERYSLSSNTAQLQPLDNVFGMKIYLLVAGTGCDAKPFNIPVKMSIRNEDAYVVDCRQVTGMSNAYGHKITNQPDFTLLGLLGLSAAIWDSPDRHMMASIASDLSPIYATWISSTVSAGFNLAIDQRTEISIIAAYFYWCLLGIETNINKISARIAQDLKLDFDRVIGVVEECGELKSVEGLIEAFKKTSGGIRLSKLDVPTLYQVSAGVWSGALGRPTMEVAIEYPPYIVMLAGIALTDRSYRRTRFFEYVSLFDRRPEIKQLPDSIAHLKRSK